MEQTKMKKGFTLAEVLITLGVIGIVAAMTIPNLVQSYKKKVIETKLVKFYSLMNNAIKLAEVDYGPQSTWTDYYETNEFDENGKILYQKGDKYDAHVKKYFAPYLKITNSEVVEDAFLPQKIYYLSDGSAFSFSLSENREIYFYPSDPKKCLQNPHPNGSCVFTFSFIPYIADVITMKRDYKYNLYNGIQPTLYRWSGDEESLMTDTTYGCKNGNAVYCVEVIRRNGWKIPEDYPYKF